MEDELAGYPGVVDTKVGYTGGNTRQPSYEQVCSKNTGHAEAVQVIFDPAKTSYKKLVSQFLQAHNPLWSFGSDRQGQYRTAIFFMSEGQKQLALEAIAQYEKQNSRRVSVLLQPAGTFWLAEDYHQKYLKKQSGAFCPSRHF